MQSIVKGIFNSEQPDNIKIAILKRVIKEINSVDSTENLKDVVFICTLGFNETIKSSSIFYVEVVLLVKTIVSKLSLESLKCIYETILNYVKCTEDLSYFDFLIGPSMSYISKKILELHSLIVLKDPSSLNNLYQCIKFALGCQNSYGKDWCFFINKVIDASLLSADCLNDISDVQYFELIDQLFMILKLLDKNVAMINNDEMNIATSISKYILFLLTQSKLLVCSRITRSVLFEHLYILLRDTLTDSNFECHNLLVVSVLCEFNGVCEDNFTETLVDFINKVVNDCVNKEMCINILRRLTIWLSWSTISNAYSPLDVWIIGFQSAIFRKLLICKTPFLFDEYWSNFIDWQLQFVIELMDKVSISDLSLLNVLAFFILCGGLTLKDIRINRISLQIPSTINQLIISFKQNTCANFALVRFYKISRLLDVSLHDCNSNYGEELSQNVLRQLINHLSVRFIDELSLDVWYSRYEVYKMKTLIHFGARAGCHLRKLWSRWDDEFGIHFNDQDLPFTLKKISRNRQFKEHNGLQNVGNTCYANAALQLLYHCPDFRHVLLGTKGNINNDNISCDTDSDNFISGLKSGHISDHSYQLNANQKGSLHAQLFTLFQLLHTHQSPTVHDLYTILIRTKPSHFISGEQQDAVEYLNYLLDRLHEEEVCSEDHPNQNKPSIAPSSLNTKDIISSPNSNSIDHQLSDLSVNNQTDCKSKLMSSSSKVLKLFGGTLLRRTSCTECNHISSTRQEEFICLYVPLSNLAYQKQVECENSEDVLLKVQGSGNNDQSIDLGTDLASLIGMHFAQIEYVASGNQCESCAKQTIQARCLELKQLSSYVLICLNLFTFCRAKQTSSKIMHRIRIPERLSVTLSSSTNETKHEFSETLFDGKSYTDISTQSSINSDINKGNVSSRSYILQAMIIHRGVSISCGHYTCVARVGMQWILFDDDCADYTTLEEVYSEPLATPYLLLYKQL